MCVKKASLVDMEKLEADVTQRCKVFSWAIDLAISMLLAVALMLSEGTITINALIDYWFYRYYLNYTW